MHCFFYNTYKNSPLPRLKAYTHATFYTGGKNLSEPEKKNSIFPYIKNTWFALRT